MATGFCRSKPNTGGVQPRKAPCINNIFMLKTQNVVDTMAVLTRLVFAMEGDSRGVVPNNAQDFPT